MLGPLAGGLIVGLLHWRVIFFVNLPIGLLGLFLVYRHLPDYRAQHMSRLDWVGPTLFGSGVALLSFVLEVFGEHTMSGWECSFLLAVSVLLLLAYVKHASSAPHPLLRLDLFQIRTLRSALTGSFVTRLGVDRDRLSLHRPISCRDPPAAVVFRNTWRATDAASGRPISSGRHANRGG
jgi:hypothetical protein